MITAIRLGFTSTLHSLGAWWRARRRRDPAAPATSPDIVETVRSADADAFGAAHAGEALRQFLAYALDENNRLAVPAELDDGQRRIIAAGAAALANLDAQARYLPRRPSLLPRLMSALNSDQNSMRELAAIIQDDPALMGNLLRLANSAFYRGVRKSIDSLEHAVTMVGTDGIRGLIATALLHPVMTTRSGRFARFADVIWEQTLYAADAAEMHAVHVERMNGFGARLLALLRGLATNTAFRIVRDECLDGCDASAAPAIVQLLAQWTPPTARRIAASWEMPNELQFALDPAREPGALNRSLAFGWLAGAQLLMVKHGCVKEAAARATVLAIDERRMQADKVWARLTRAHLKPG